jgi:hypothetical protein
VEKPILSSVAVAADHHQNPRLKHTWILKLSTNVFANTAMAEIGMAASIIGNVSASIKPTTSLYEFGSTVSSMREQIDYISKHAILYS